MLTSNRIFYIYIYTFFNFNLLKSHAPLSVINCDHSATPRPIFLFHNTRTTPNRPKINHTFTLHWFPIPGTFKHEFLPSHEAMIQPCSHATGIHPKWGHAVTSTDAQLMQLFSAIAVAKSLVPESMTGLFVAHVPVSTSCQGSGMDKVRSTTFWGRHIFPLW